MIIFKDIITNDELFTDSNKLNLIDDCLYEVKCTFVTRREDGIVLDGANPSAEGEDGDHGSDAHVESGLDLVLNQKLKETSFKKSEYLTYLKGYTKTLMDKWKEQKLTPEQIDENKAKITAAVKLVVPKLSDAQFFTGESCNPDGMVPVLQYRDNDKGEEEAFMYFYKHGLEKEKV